MDHRFVSRTGLFISKFAIWSIVTLVMPSAFIEADTTRYYKLPYLDGPVGYRCELDYYEIIDILNCLHSSGYVYAHATEIENSDLPKVVIGPQLRVSSLKSSDNISYLSSTSIQQMGSVRIGEVLDVQKFKDLAIFLQDRSLVEDPVFSFSPNNFGDTVITLNGKEPVSSLSFGAFVDGEGDKSLSLYGKHFSNVFVPGYLKYNLSFGDELHLQNSVITLPIGYSNVYTSSLGLNFRTEQRFEYSESVAQLALLREYHHDKREKQFLPLSVVSFDITNYNFDGFGIHSDESYLSLSAEFGNPSQELSWGLRFSASSSLTQDSLWTRGDAFLTLVNSDSLGESFRFSMHGVASIVSGSLSRIPVQQRLYVGGSSSVRGLRDRELGMFTTIGEFVGGNRSVIIRNEFAKSLPEILSNAEIGGHLDFGLLAENNRVSEPVASSGLFFRFANEGASEIDLTVSRPITYLNTGWRISLSLKEVF